MCGIAYVKRLDGKTAEKMVAKRYRKQKSRGSEGFGFVSLKDGEITWKRTADEKGILKQLESQKSTEIIFHHRMPTSTPNFAECAHPIKVRNDLLKNDYYVIHNGIIWNADELKKAHELLGFKYRTEVKQQWSVRDTIYNISSKFNDSESLAIELAIAIDENREGISELTGSVAFIALQVPKDKSTAPRLYFGRNSYSPLILDRLEGVYISITSEGKGQSIKEDTLYWIEDDKIDCRNFKVGKKYVYPISTGYNSTRGYETDQAVIPYEGYGDVDDIETIQTLEEYYQCVDEYKEIQKEITMARYTDARSGLDRGGETDIDYLEYRLQELDDMIRNYDAKAQF